MKGTTVQLVVKTQTGTDEFGAPVYEETLETVSDVLIGQPSTNDLADSIDLDGKRIDYVLGIPKGDTHNWVDTEIIFFGQRFKTVGYPQTGIQENIPLRWGQNVKVVHYG
jgi:hypothetical protein